jgi:L-lactate dehydrogenase
VAVIGAGHVGAAVANALVLLRASDRVVIYDRNLTRAEGEAWDVGDAVPLLSELEVVPTDDYADLRDADVVVITVGATNPPGHSRLELLATNATIIRSVIAELDRVCPEAVVILASNPVDVLTRIAIETSRRPAHLIFGSGTVLDGARLRHELGKLLDVEQESVHVYVVGEHGDSSLAVWSSATVGAAALADCRLPEGTALEEVQTELVDRIHRRGRMIHERRGFTAWGLAAAIARLVRAVIHDEKRIFMVSVRAPDDYGIGPVVLSLPCVVAAAGIGRQLHLRMSAAERAQLRASAQVLEAAYRSLDASGTGRAKAAET